MRRVGRSTGETSAEVAGELAGEVEAFSENALPDSQLMLDREEDEGVGDIPGAANPAQRSRDSMEVLRRRPCSSNPSGLEVSRSEAIPWRPRTSCRRAYPESLRPQGQSEIKPHSGERLTKLPRDGASPERTAPQCRSPTRTHTATQPACHSRLEGSGSRRHCIDSLARRWVRRGEFRTSRRRP